MLRVMVALLAFCATPDLSSIDQARLERLQVLQASEIKERELKLVELEARRKKALKKERDEIIVHIKNIKKRLAEVKDGDIDPPYVSWGKMQVGQIGTVGGMYLEVIGIVDPETMLVIPYSDLSEYGRWDPVMLKGWPTKGVVNEKHIEPGSIGCVEVIGTKTYNAVRGSKNTVFVLSPFPIEKLKPFLKVEKK